MVKFLRLLHIYVSMAVVIALMFYALTGITLNHPEWHSSWGEQRQEQAFELPEQLKALAFDEEKLQRAQTASQIADWLRDSQHIEGAVFNFDVDLNEQLLELDFKRPAGFTNVEIDLSQGTGLLSVEFNGWLALLNDLHKGRYVGASWRWFSDLVAIACLLFAISGFYLLWRQNSRRWHGVATAFVGVVALFLAYAFALH